MIRRPPRSTLFPLHDALPISLFGFLALYDLTGEDRWLEGAIGAADYTETWTYAWSFPVRTIWPKHPFNRYSIRDRKSTRLNSSHANISYAVFCLKKKKQHYLP